MKRVISILLLAAIMAVSGCGGTETPDNDTSAKDQTTAEPVETDVFDGIEVQNHDGREFRWMIPDMDAYKGDMWVQEATGEIYDDAIYRRNSLVQERFGIEIVPIIEEYTWDLRDQYLGKIRSSVQSGDNAYDLVACHSYIMPSLILDGMLMNLSEIDELRFDKPWWSQRVYENTIYNGKIFFMTGDVSVNVFEFANVIFMNNRIREEFGLDAPYQLVRDGKWTTAALEKMIKDTSRDLDGNGVYDGKDSHGYIYHDASTINTMPVSFGSNLTRREGKSIVFNLDNDKAVECAEYIKKFLGENPDVHSASEETGGRGKEIFMDGRAMFYAHQLHTLVSMREMEDDYGIVPFPKYDEAQENYYTTIRDSYIGLGIPADVKDTEFVGRIMEALCVSGSKYIFPAYYDVLLKGKTARDEGSLEMLDLIKGSISVDFAAAYGIELGNMVNLYSQIFLNGEEFASSWASRKNTANEQLAKLLEYFN